MTKNEFDKKVEYITQKYQPEIDQLKKDGEELQEEGESVNGLEALVNVDFKIEWVDTKIAITIPGITMVQKDISFDVPEVTTKTTKVSFKIPEVKMETYCAFKRPVFRGLQVSMECTYLDKPVVKMVPKEIKTDIPQVTMKSKSISLDVPEIRSELIEFIITLPQITVTEVNVKLNKIEEKSEKLQQRGHELQSRMQDELQVVTAQFLSGKSHLETTFKNETEAEYSKGIAEIGAIINDLKSKDIDPVKVSGSDGNINVRKMHNDLISKRDSTLERLDDLLETS